MVTLTSLATSLCLLSTLYHIGNGQECSSRIRCGDCIGIVGCSWCATLNLEGSLRCSANLSDATCNQLENSMGSMAIKTRSAAGNPVSVTNVNLTLGVGQPRTFTMTVTPLRNLPLDLYVLIDLSASMTEELQSLKNVAGDIANRIANVTNNVRIGFGAFNDKVTRPFTDFQTVSEGQTCNRQQCRPNYAFRHQITLTDNITFYQESLQGIVVTFNTDRPENGLEGLAQVVACEDIIGWRNRMATGQDRGLTRVVLFMTDDAFHYAGEGQFAGILKPYEGQCLLEAGDLPVEFTKWDEVDYPSVGQVIQMLQENEVAVIFAITQDRLATYNNLAELIRLRFRASVSELQEEGTNILSLIDEEYRRILQEVRLVPDDSDELQISVTPMCPADTNETATGCDLVPLDQPVEFEVTVTLNNCANFRNSSTYREHRVVAPGFGDFTINYRGDCLCECEISRDRVIAAGQCNSNGDFVCGVCECYPGWCGSSCELKIGAACACEALTDTCPRNATDGQLCYGQGACCDGTCICRNNSNGFFYRHSANQMDCACPPAEEVCRTNPRDPGTGCVNGTCGCRGCDCQSGFIGRFCQSRGTLACNDEMDRQCLRRCVESNFNSDVCMTCEANRPILVVDVAGNDQNILSMVVNEANRRLPTGNIPYEFRLDCSEGFGICTYDYFLLEGPEMFVIVLQQTPAICVDPNAIVLPFPAWVFIFIVIGILLLLGIIIFVLIKVIITILDYLEVKRWERETKDADFSKNQNPLYQSPEMKYENVAYGRE